MTGLVNSLFWRISFFFLAFLIGLSAIYIYITATTSEEYFQETSQNLHRSTAESIASHNQPVLNGELNDSEVKEIFHDVMVVNPSVEVYLLDTEGKILSFFAPKSKVKLEQVALGPIQRFLEGENETAILGEDPRNPGVFKAFSAAEMREGDSWL